MVNVDPPEELPDHWHKEFRSQYRECISPKYDEFDKERYRQRLHDQIQKEREHRRLLNLCVFPFTSDPSPSNFKFIHADPLTELDVPNFDFLLWDFEKHAVFVEAKANIRQGATSLVNEVDEQIEVVEDHEEYIIENYLGKKPRNKEYVMATYSSDAEDITRSIIKEGSEIVTWAVHQMGKSISVNTALQAPPDDEEFEETRRRIRHSNQELNGTLEQAETAEGAFNIFPNVDPVSKLRTLITAREKNDGYCFVNVDEVRDIICDDLFYLDEDTADSFVEDVLELGKRLTF